MTALIELAAVIGMEAEDFEGEGVEGGGQGREQEGFGDIFDADDDFPLKDFIDHVDVVDALFTVEIALVHGVDADEPRATVGFWFSSDPDGNIDAFRFGDGEGASPVKAGGSQVVDVCGADFTESLKTDVAEKGELPLEIFRVAGPESRSWALSVWARSSLSAAV